MSETLRHDSPFAGVLLPGEEAAGAEPVVIRALPDCAIVQVMARKGRLTLLRRRLRKLLGATVPSKPLAATAGNGVLLGATGPLEYWALAETLDEAALGARLSEAVGDAASLVNQSHGRAVLRLGGAHAVDVLAKGCPLDLHPRAFPTPGAAQTAVERMPLLVVKRDAAPTFDLALPRSYAGSFVAWLKASALEFGYRVEGP